MNKAIVVKIASKRMLNIALQLRKHHAGVLLKTVRSIKSINLNATDINNFGEGLHTPHTEPYYYDSSYQSIKRNYAIPIDSTGKAVCNGIVSNINDPKKWKCSEECKLPICTKSDNKSIHNLK